MCLVAVLACCFASPTWAANYYWDNNGTNAGFGTASGTWAVPTTGDASQGWSTNAGGTTLPENVTTATADALNFGNGATGLGAGTITVNTVSAGSLTFASGSGDIVLAGGTITLPAAAIITVADSTDTINSALAGAGTSFTIGGGPGPLVLDGASTYTGKTILGNNVNSSLTIQVSNLQNLNVASSLGKPTTAANGVIQIGNTSRSSTLEYVGASAASTDRQVQIGLSGSGSGGSIIVNNNPNAAHTLTFANAVFNVAASGVSSSFNRSLTLGGSNTGDNTIQGAIIPNTGGTTTSLTKSGTGTWVLAGENTYTGNSTISGGTLKLRNELAFQDSTVVMNGGTLVFDSAAAGTAFTFGGLSATNAGDGFDITLMNNAAGPAGVSLTIGNNNTSRAYAGVLGGTGSLIKIGSGVQTLSGANTYTGTTTVNEGTLQVDGFITGATIVASGGTLGGNGTLGGAVTVESGGTFAPGALTINSNLVLNSGSTSSFAVNGSTPTNDIVFLGSAVTYGGVLTIVPSGSFTVGQTFILFSGVGATNAGNFDGLLGSPGSGQAFAFTNGVLKIVTDNTATIRVEAAANGSANAAVPAQTLTPGQSITSYAIARDAGGAFLKNITATWVLTNVTGSVVSANLVAAPDGRSAVFTANGQGAAQILAIAGATNLVPSGIITVPASTNTTNRPFIWVRDSERSAILAKIATNAWASNVFNGMVSRVAADLVSHQNDRDAFLRGLSVNWAASPPTFNTSTYAYNTGESYFNKALDCAVLYYLTGDSDYARCAADILHNSVQAFQNLAPSTSTGNGGWLIPGDLLYEARQVGCQLPVVYDFLYAFLQTNQVYEVDATNLVNFSFPDAQYVFRTYYQLVRDHGQKDSNWSALMSTCMLNNLLALDSVSERATALQIYLTTGSSRQASLQYDYRHYGQPGNIWPESLQYAGGVGSIRSTHMALLERYDPTLNLFGVYSNLPTSLPRISYLVYPNDNMQISFGDGHRSAQGHPYFRYELMYQHAKARGRTNLTALFGPLINNGVALGDHNRSALVAYNRLGQHDEPLQLLWWVPAIPESAVTPVLPRTDTLPFAGIALQRNPVPVNNSTYGLMGFVGGAAHVHSHACGMAIEIFGLGQVMGAKAGRDDYGSAIHENYYRVFAANNTVIVNAASQGSGGWAGLGINTVQTVAMEPQPFAVAVSSNFSFTCSSFADNMGANAEATQQRTLAILRTSPTNGFYVDFFRSKSTVTNRAATTLSGNVTNQFHDYIYRNVGSTNITVTTNGVTLPLVSQSSRFQNDIGDGYDQPGWRYFTNTVVSYPHSQPVRAQFVATPSGTPLYMDMILPAVTNREYARVSAPPIVDYSSTAQSPAIVVRQVGDAWDKPFATVYEPHFGVSGGTVTNVTTLLRGSIVVGLKIDGNVAGKSTVHYVFSNPNATESYTNAALGLVFKGRFGVVADNGDGTTALYLGQGSSLSYRGNSVNVVGGANSQAEVQFVPGQSPQITANAPVTTVAVSAPRFTQITPLVSGVISLTGTGSNGVPYRLWGTTNLSGGPWTVLNTGTVTNSPFVISDAGAVSNGTRFYRFSTP